MHCLRLYEIKEMTLAYFHFNATNFDVCCRDIFNFPFISLQNFCILLLLWLIFNALCQPNALVALIVNIPMIIFLGQMVKPIEAHT